MKVEKYLDGFLVRKGDAYFALYVDATGSSWTKHRSIAHSFATEDGAERAIEKLRGRERARREERKRRNA